MRAAEVREELRQKAEKTGRWDGEPEEPAELPDDDAERDAIQIARQDRPCQKVRQEPEPRNARRDAQHARDDRQRHGERDVAVGVMAGKRGDGGRDNRAGGGVGRHDQLPGRPEQRVGHEWKDAGVEPVRRRHSRELGVGDRNWHGHRGH